MSKLSNGRPSRMKNSHHTKRESCSPLNSHCQTSRSLWARSYKNEPVPTQIRRRLMGKKYQFDESDEEDQQVMAVLQQQEQQQIEQKGSLSKFKVIRDWDEFSQSRRHKIHSTSNLSLKRQRCGSAAQFKLQQVPQQKKQQDEQKKRGVPKLSQFRDNNQFNDIGHRISSDGSEKKSRAQSVQVENLRLLGIPEQVVQNEIDETRSDVIHIGNHKVKLSEQFSKLIVDEMVLKEKRQRLERDEKEQMHIIQEQKQEEEVDTSKLAELIGKFEENEKQLGNIQDDQQIFKSQQQASQQPNIFQ